MILLRLLDVVSIVLASLVLGVFWGPWLGLTRSLDTLSAPGFLAVVHRMDKNLGRNMTILFPLTLVAAIAVLVLSFGTPLAFWLGAAGVAMFVLALIVTMTIEVPIVTKIRDWTEITLPTNWQALRNRWVSFHLLRVIPGILGVALLSAGALWQH